MKTCHMLLLMCTLSISSCSLAGEKKSDKKVPEMNIITKWEDVAQFADSIVIYRAKNSSFAQKEEGYQIDPNSPTPRVGYVKLHPSKWDSEFLLDGEEGYELEPLYKKDAIGSSCALINSEIAKSENKSIQMRRATPAEKAAIRKALDAREAQFMYQFLIDDALTRLLPKSQEKD